LGRLAPPRAMVGVGKPDVVIVNVPAVPAVNVTLLVLVMAGASLTDRVKFWTAEELTALVAVNVSAYEPAVPAAGGPLSVPVPFPLSTNVTPDGKTPPPVIAGVGTPRAVTVKVPAVPALKAALSRLVIAGGGAKSSVVGRYPGPP